MIKKVILIHLEQFEHWNWQGRARWSFIREREFKEMVSASVQNVWGWTAMEQKCHKISNCMSEGNREEQGTEGAAQYQLTSTELRGKTYP